MSARTEHRVPMRSVSTSDITGILARWTGGDLGAFDQLTSSVYDYLHRIASRAIRRTGAIAATFTLLWRA